MARSGFVSWVLPSLLLLSFLACLLNSPSARAQAAPCSTSGQCDQGQAFIAAISLADSNGSRICKQVGGNDSAYSGHAVRLTSPGVYTAYVNCTKGGSTANAGTTFFSKSCSSREQYTGTGPWSSGAQARNGSIGCQAGCDGAWFSNSDNSMTFIVTGDLCPNDEKGRCDSYGEGHYWNAVLKVCEPPEGKCQDGRNPNSLGKCQPEPCPDGKISQADGTCKNKDNECPAGQIKSPDGKCLPGEGQCAAGEARGKDGTCKRDSNNDGEPDEGEEEGEGPDGEKVKENFGGGDDCTTPPSCSGAPILCGQARIQWRIDCNTRKNRNIAGGTCSSMPICTGEKCDALEYSGLLMQWRTACAVEKLSQGTGGGDGSQPAWTSVAGMSQDPGAGATANDTKVLTVKKLSVDDLDQSGIGGGGGGCIGFAASGGTGMGAGFAQAMASPPAFFCTYIGALKAICIIGASVVSVIILVSGGKS